MRRTLLVVAALVLPLSGCGQGGARVDPATVEPSAFAGGSCLVLAPDLVLLRGYLAQTLADDPASPALDPRDAVYLRREADRFRQGSRLARGAVRAPLAAFVAALEALAGEGASPDRFRRALRDAEALIVACT